MGGRSRGILAVLVVTFGLILASPALLAAAGLDYDLPNGSGHFYTQANGQGGLGGTGYAITNRDGIPFWDVYRQLGGPDALGYPVSRRFIWDGFTVQAMQKVVFQWHPENGTIAFVNVLDRMHELGLDGWLEAYRQTPPPFATAADTGLTWPSIEQRHWALLDANPAIKARYWRDSDPLAHFGLPMSAADEGGSFVIRAQRAVFQYWKVDVPWAHQGDVTIANAGDLAKEAGLFPALAITPEPPPGTATAPVGPSHDWRAPGYVAAFGGQLFDAQCRPLRSVGINVPNLPYRRGLAGTLSWMHDHHLRWMRVFATGHELGPDRRPQNASAAVTALRALLSRVQSYNAAHDSANAIYVLVSLTDYYPPGVPGDRYAYDHPTFSLSPVLPAPWFRAGPRSFDFDQEHNFGLLHGLPNYEVNYKPWVSQIVSSLSDSPALLGWQLGNELKARGSPRNAISSSQAYSWYLAFGRDMVDTIRATDRHHLIFQGAQYIGELTDWEYRPHDQLAPDRVPIYRQLAQQMLDDCGNFCWNVWSLTAYDFNPYPLDDAAFFEQAGVPVVATEYGFTRGTTAEMVKRFGGDRAMAVRDGLTRPWQDLTGRAQARFPSVSGLLSQGLLAGAAPWGSPPPGPDSFLDADSVRGIAGAPDETALWNAWTDVAARAESANRVAGVSATCQMTASGRS